MSAVTGFFNAFGYHTAQFDGMKNYQISNIGKAIGYIPLFGSAIGVIRIVTTVSLMRESRANLAFNIGLIVRGILETLCLSLVLAFVIDPLVTLVRHINCGRSVRYQVNEPALE